jgi:hypothetical protein
VLQLHPELGSTRTRLHNHPHSTTHTSLEIPRSPQSRLFYILPATSTPNHQYSLRTLCVKSSLISAQSIAILHLTAFPSTPTLDVPRDSCYRHLSILWPSLVVDDLLDATKYPSSPPAHLKWRAKLCPAHRVVLPLHIPSTTMQIKRDARCLFGARSRGTSVPCTPSVRFCSTIKSV